MIRIEKTLGGNFLLKFKRQEISFDEKEFEQLREAVQAQHYKARLLAELESEGYDSNAVAANKDLMDNLVGLYAHAIEGDDGFDAEGELAYEIVSDAKDGLGQYRKNENQDKERR